MEPIHVMSLLLLLIIFLLIISRAQKGHQDWLNAWNELARCAKVVDQQGKFVSAENFYGDCRGLTVELRIITKHIDPICDSNIFTRITVHIEGRVEGILGRKFSLREKRLGKKPFHSFNGRIINLEGSMESRPKDFSTKVFSDPEWKFWLLNSNFSQLEYRENQLDLYFPGIVTDVAGLHAGLILLYKLAEHIIELETIQDGDFCTECL